MFLVTDLTIKPEPDDIERGHIDPEAIVYLKVEEAIAALCQRVRFSLAYEIDSDNPPDPEPPLRPQDESVVDTWRSCQNWNPNIRPLRIDTRDYQHLLIPLASLA